MTNRQEIRFRVYVAFTGICLFGAIIIMKAAWIQLKEGKDLIRKGTQMHTRVDTLKADRGNIYTEDGQLLSSSVPQFDVHIDFSVIDSALFAKNIDTLCIKLADLFSKDTEGGATPEGGMITASEFKDEFVREYENESAYYLLARNLKYNQYEALRSFPIFKKGKGYGGFIVDTKDKRLNPYMELGLRTIGTFKDSSLTGLEATYDSVLTGENGRRIVKKTTGDSWIAVDGSETDPQNGSDIVTTLDMNIQDIADKVLRSVLEKFKCEYGTVIVMEVKTGKIRSLVNLTRKPTGDYSEDLNYALTPTEPGSTFKLVTLLSLLNDKYINVDNDVDAKGGAIKFNGSTMKDSHSGLGVMKIWKAYAESSNAAMAYLANNYYKNDPGKFVKHLLDLRLDKPTGIDMLGERPTLVKIPGKSKSWSRTTLPWMATGYEVKISPMHTCMLYNAIANNGTMMKPYIVSSIKQYGKEVSSFKPTVLVPHIGDSSTISQLQRCTRAVVVEGTANSISSPFYAISGKTGTAKVADVIGKRKISYEDKVYQGSFVGYFPSEQPRYTICVVIRTQPNSQAYYGGLIAAPVFRMIADKIYASTMGAWGGTIDSFSKKGGGRITALKSTAKTYHTLFNAMQQPGLSPSDAKDLMASLTRDSTDHQTVQTSKPDKVLVPDVRGMSLRDAVHLLEYNGLQVKVRGKGRVSDQSLPPGSKLIKGQNIVLQLT